MKYHAHYNVEMKDCDGITELSRVLLSQPEQSDEEFESATVTWLTRWPQNLYFTTIDGDKQIYTDEETDEGYSRIYVSFCHKDCADDPPSFRDHNAERQGY